VPLSVFQIYFGLLCEEDELCDEDECDEELDELLLLRPDELELPLELELELRVLEPPPELPELPRYVEAGGE
jgi:hypothetical protein